MIKKTFLRIAILIFSIICISPSPVSAYMVKYKEDYYRLFHVHYQQYPDDCIENIYWLEKAVQADFANPLYADAQIKSKKEWEKYRYLYMMHLNLKLVEQHTRLARTYDKKQAFFYDAPWKDEYLKNLAKAMTCYQAGLYYWKEAALWAEKANATSFKFLFVTDLQNWEDERERIGNKDLDYGKILSREIKRLQDVTDSFIAMDSKNY